MFHSNFILFFHVIVFLYFFFFFNDTATTEIYTLSLHDALPICGGGETALLLAPIGLVLAASLAGLHPFPTSSVYRLSDRYYPFYGRLLLFAVPLALPCIAAGAGLLLDSASRLRRLAGVAALAILFL